MDRILFTIVFAASTFLAVAQPNFIPDTNLRNSLNLFEPVVDADGYLIDPDRVLSITVTTTADMPPVDLTGLEYTVAADLRLDNSQGGSFSSWPAFPEFVVGAEAGSAMATLEFFDGDEIPPLPVNLGLLIINSPTRIDSWTLSGYDDDVYTEVEINDLPATIPQPTIVERLDQVGLNNWPHAVLPPLGTGVGALSVFIANALTDLTISDPIKSFGAGFCPLVTSITFTAAIDTLYSVGLANMDNLTELIIAPVVSNILDVQVPSLTTLSVPDCLDLVSLCCMAPSAFANLPPSTKRLHLDSFIGLELLDLPNGLEILELTGMDTQVLPDIPETLRELRMNVVGVASLAPLPEGLTTLEVNQSQLQCLPLLPSSLTSISCDLACFPNQPPNVQTLPLCTILNSYCPETNPTISGHVFVDINGDGVQDAEEPDAYNVTLLFMPSGRITGTDTIGNYAIGLPIGEHTVSLIDGYRAADVVEPDVYVTTLATLDTAVEGMDFRIIPPVPPPADLALGMMHAPALPRPGFERRVFFSVSATSFPGPMTLTLVIDPLEEFESAGFPIATIVDNVITSSSIWVSDYDLSYRVSTPTNVPLGTQFTHTITLGTLLDDPTPWNNVRTFQATVVGSFDPNDKQVFPPTLTPDEVDTDTLVEYTIRFQNTGTYEAERVVITDTLPSALRWDSFRFITSSHPCEWFVREGVAHFVFNNIHLPDSNANEPGSHGFARFAIRPITTLQEGESVTNIANIYFDFNEPVITEPCVLQVEVPTAVTGPEAVPPSLYPVPAHDHLNMTMPGTDLYQAVIVSMDGRVAMTLGALRSTARMDVRALAPGAYVLRLASSTGKQRYLHFIKE